jgi:DNA polymerase-3 subunit alpha
MKTDIPGQLNLFDNTPSTFKEKPAVYRTETENFDNSNDLCLKMEKEVMGVYLSSHPLKKYEEQLKRLSSIYSFQILGASENSEDIYDNMKVSIAGIISGKTVRVTKKGMQMATFTLEDMYGAVDVVVFPKKFSEYSTFITNDNIVVIKGNLIINEDETPRVSLNEISLFNENTVTQKLYLKIEDERKLTEIKQLLKTHSGNTPVYVYFAKEKRNTIADKSLWVTLSRNLIDSLKGILGEENVVIV